LIDSSVGLAVAFMAVNMIMSRFVENELRMAHIFMAGVCAGVAMALIA